MSGRQYSPFLIPIVSTPNSGLLLRISPFILILDEFSYYAYHNKTYDPGFVFLVELSWNVTNFKWIPSFLDGPIERFTSLLSNIFLNDTQNATPQRFRVGGENLFFLNNTQEFFLITLTLAAFTFVIYKQIFRWVYPSALANFLRPFSSYSYLLSSLLGDNIQYLSFRSFEQLRYYIPARNLPSFANLALTTTAFFVVTVAALCLYLMVWSLSRQAYHS